MRLAHRGACLSGWLDYVSQRCWSPTRPGTSTDAVVRRHIRALLDAAARSTDTKDKAMAKAKTDRATDADTIAVGVARGQARDGEGRLWITSESGLGSSAMLRASGTASTGALTTPALVATPSLDVETPPHGCLPKSPLACADRCQDVRQEHSWGIDAGRHPSERRAE